MIATDMSSASEGTGILFNLDGEVIGMILLISGKTGEYVPQMLMRFQI